MPRPTVYLCDKLCNLSNVMPSKAIFQCNLNGIGYDFLFYTVAWTECRFGIVADIHIYFALIVLVISIWYNAYSHI